MKKTTYGATTQILLFPQNKQSFGVIVNDTGVTANAQGKKIIPAGTPVGGADPLQNEKAVLSVVNDGSAQGVLEFDADVTEGQANATMVFAGYVNETRIPNVTISDAVKAAVKGRLFFAKRR